MEFQLNRRFQIMYISTFRWNVLFWRNFKENTVHFGCISLGTVSNSHVGSQKLSKTSQLCFDTLRNRVQVSLSHLEVASCSTAYLEEPNFQAGFRRNSFIKNSMIFDQKILSRAIRMTRLPRMALSIGYYIVQYSNICVIKR